MLTHLQLDNYTIVEHLELTLSQGMTALTGETGAGKSILVDALGLVLGDRADASVIRYGAKQAEICATFSIEHHPLARQWLIENTLLEDDECLLRRVFMREGRSRAFINGRPVALQQIKQLGELLVDIHGQHQHQSLLKQHVQRQLLDDYAGNQDILDQLRDIHRQWSQTLSQLRELDRESQNQQERKELLHYQIQELKALDVSEDEYDRLGPEQLRLANAGEILHTCLGAISKLYELDEQSIHDQINQVISELDELGEFDQQVTGARQLLSEASIQIREAVDELRHHSDGLELDPERLEWVEQRLGAIHDMARKHHCEPEQLTSLLQQLEQEADQIQHNDQQLNRLKEQLEQLQDNYSELAAQLTKRRQKAAKQLNKKVTALSRELGMPGAEFSLHLDRTNNEPVTRFGDEQITFYLRANPGQPEQALSKIASGGELSRISLAIQAILANNTQIPTLIYDEVDAGIGGATAEMIGRQLRTLGQNRQVICVTHLAQVAAQAHQHLQVTKTTHADSVETQLVELSDKDRVEEIARMMGGENITSQGLAHARQMIKAAMETDSASPVEA